MSGEMPDEDMREIEESFQLKEDNPNIFESSAQEIVLWFHLLLLT